MARISTVTEKIAGVGVRAVGFEGEAVAGPPTTRGGRRLDDLDVALRAIGADAGGDGPLAVRAELTVQPVWAAGGTSRGGGTQTGSAPPVLELDGPERGPDEVGQIAIVEEEGLLRFVLPEEGTTHFVIELGDGRPGEAGADRGLTFKAASIAIRIVGVLGGKAVARRGFALAARAIEGKARPSRLRTFLPDDFRQPFKETLAVRALTGPNALLLLHGVNSSSHTCFRFPPEYVKRLARLYERRVIAFDHPSLAFSPKENAAHLAELLSSFRLENVDVLAHSRGGLVARELAAAPPPGVHLRSIVHVATPNSGTPLADAQYLNQFLGVATNVISLIPDNPVSDVVGIVLEILREWVLEPAGELAGVAALKPSSPDLAALNSKASPIPQRAIAAAFEPRSNQGALMRLRDLVMDQVFKGEDNDLMVPTRSTYERNDQFHIPVDRRLVLDGSFGVCHSQFWTDNQVALCLDRWLDPAVEPERAEPAPARFTDPAAELDQALGSKDVAALRLAVDALDRDENGVMEEAAKQAGGPLRLSTTAARTSEKGGTVIVLPGIMGSRLAVGDREIWFNPWHLVRGRFTKLRMDTASPPQVEVTGLVRQYAPLLAQLDKSWDVVPFAYDWRQSIQDSADRLAELITDQGLEIAGDRPVHFVGHSMGGLVARVYLQGHQQAWREGSGRLVQLGTPNWGSFAMPLAVHGEERLVRALALGDLANSPEEVLDTIASFPGVIQLFPSPWRPAPGVETVEHRGLFEASVWPARTAANLAASLTAAESFHASLREARLERTVYVAGDGQRTPFRARVEPDGQLSFGVTSSGDGRVPHSFGHQDLGIDSVHYASCAHGDLIGDARVLAALDDLLIKGWTDSLPTDPGAMRDGPAVEPEVWLKASQLERSFAVPVGRGSGDRGAGLLAASEIYLGSTGQPRTTLPPIRVRIVHGSLEQARHPVAAGRYKGIPIDGALGFIDDRFGGALSDLHEAGLYPDEAGTARYLRAPEHVYPVGAILLGLGEFGSLTPDLLARAVERGTADYALAAQRQARTPKDLGVSAVLVGTPGRYGLTIVTSILATIRGVARAAANLQGKVTINELEIVELSEARALEAAAALERLHESAELTSLDAPIEIDTAVESRAGGRPGSHGYEESGAPWPRLMLELDTPPEEGKAAAQRRQDANLAEEPGEEVRTLKYVSLGRRAQASNLEVQVVLSQIDRHVRAAIQDPRANTQTNNTLFELLLPNEAKLELETLENLHLLLDESTAWIPWEVIAGRETTGQQSRPLALRAGLLRQLKPRDAEPPRRVLRAVTPTALVIGDPPAGDELPRLLNARQEAELVADALGDADFDVTRCIYRDGENPSPELAAGLLDRFFEHHYRIIHIAGHGHFDEDSKDPLRNGVVIGDHEILGPVQFRQRLVAPDLVFLNCCHIGRIDADDGSAQRRSRQFAHLAASLSLELLRSGVTAVIAAGWAVNDRAAAEFATRFYRCMLAGHTLGEAVKEARTAAYDLSHDNTWAAYQCYGDPDFQLVTSRPHRRHDRSIYSARHLVNELKAAEKRAGDVADPAHVADVVELIRTFERTAHTQFDDNAEVWLALGQAYGEAGAFERAVRSYRHAIECDEKAERSVRTIDAYRQLANFEARLGAQIARGKEGPLPFAADEARIAETPADLFAAAEQRLDRLSALDDSPEFCAIRGSLFKKRASTQEGEAARLDLQRSMDAYRSAIERHAARTQPDATDSTAAPPPARPAVLNVYHASLTLLMGYALGWPDGTELRDEYLAQLLRQKASYDRDTGDYWERARIADVDATDIVVNGRLVVEERRRELVEGFLIAFRVRSTLRNRMSVIDNYHDLAHVLPTEPLRDAAALVAAELEAFRPPRGGRRP